MATSPEPLSLDVRPLLAEGIEPFGAIIEAKSRLGPGQRFVLRTPFEPLPLYSLFQNDGYHVDTIKHAEDDWEITFSPGHNLCSENHEIDLRPLEPHLHLQIAMEAVQALGSEERLVFHSKTRPNEILDQIEKETTDYDCEEAGPDHWITILWRIAR